MQVIKSLLSDISYAEKDTTKTFNISTIINQSIKRKRDSIKFYEQGNRIDLAQSEQQEIDILKDYLPIQLTREEIEIEIKEIITNQKLVKISDFKFVMNAISKSKNSNRITMSLASEIAKKALLNK